MKTPYISTFICLLAFVLPVTSHALEVTHNGDTVPGSLRHAIDNTPAGGTVTFAAGLDGGTITLTGGQLVIDKDLTIDASALPGGLAIDANGAITRHRVMQVSSGATVEIIGLTLTGGRTADGLNGDPFTPGGDGVPGGGIHNSGDLTLSRCTLSDNSTGAGGSVFGTAFGAAGFDGGKGGDGGGIYNNSGATLTLTHCTLSANTTGNGGFGGNSSFSGGGDGGDGGDGGGIYNSSGAILTLTHFTLSTNNTGNRGFGGSGGGFGNNGARGDGGDGGGVSDQGNLMLNNSLFSSNTTGFGGSGSDLAKTSGSFTGVGINFIGDLSGSGQSASGNLLDGDAMLDPLADNGGPTQTMRPLFGSPVVDPAGGASSSPFPADQRGSFRVANGTLDIGAVEFASTLIVDTLVDENDGVTVGDVSLRDALAVIQAGGTVTFAPALGGGTITLTGGQLVIGRDLNLDASSLGDGITIDANGEATNHRVLQIAAGTTVTLTRLTLSGGKTEDATTDVAGGGIYNSGDLTLTGCSIIDNATGTGSNGNGGDGGGIYNIPGAMLTLAHCTVADNTTGDGSFVGGHGGGIFSGSLAILTLTHCTVANNFTGDTRSVGTDANEDTAGSGGGIYSGGDIILSDTLIADNLTGHDAAGVVGSGPDLTASGGAFFVGDIIFIGDLSDTGLSPSAVLFSGDALLAPLGNYGGGTPVMPLLPGSPAIDPAGGSSSSPFATDQRDGVRVVGGVVDIGAVEYSASTDLSFFWLLDFDGDGSPFGVEFALGTDPFVADPGAAGNLTAPGLDGTDQASLSFGLNVAAAPNTIWVLSRSTDLTTDSFIEIYRFDGSTSAETSLPGIVSQFTPPLSPTTITVTDQNLPAGKAFYRFEALVAP